MKAAAAWTRLAEGHVRGSNTKRKVWGDAKRRQERRLEFNKRNVKRCGWVREGE